MAYGANANTDIDQVSVFGRMDDNKSVKLRRKASAAYNMIQGSPMGSEIKDGFNRDEKIDGHNVLASVQGKVRTMTGVSDGAAERATATLNALDGWVEMSLDIAHLKDIIPIEESKYDRYLSAETAKFASFLDEVFDQAMQTQVETFSGMLYGTGASQGPTRTNIGSMIAAISDGVTANNQSNYASYLTIDRTDAANTMFLPAFCNGATGNLTLDKLGGGIIAVQGNKGNPEAGLCGTAVYQRVRQLIEGFLEAEVNADLVDFGGAKARYAGCTFMLDAYCPGGTLLILDPSTWRWKHKDVPATREGIVRDPSRLATYVLHWGGWFQAYCREVRKNGKFEAIN